MSLGLFNEFMFDSIVFKPTGVALTHCSCQGKHDYFVPREHIDFVTCGRRMYIKTFIIGLSLFVAGIALVVQAATTTVWVNSSNNGYGSYQHVSSPIAVYLYAPGIVVMIVAMCGMIPTTLMLSTNYATFTSSKCTNDFAGFERWLETGDNTKEVDAATRRNYAAAQNVYEQRYAPQQAQVPTVVVIPPSSPSHNQQQQQWASPQRSNAVAPYSPSQHDAAWQPAQSVPSFEQSMYVAPMQQQPMMNDDAMMNAPSQNVNDGVQMQPMQSSRQQANANQNQMQYGEGGY